MQRTRRFTRSLRTYVADATRKWAASENDLAIAVELPPVLSLELLRKGAPTKVGYKEDAEQCNVK